MVKVLWVILVVASGFFHAEGCGTNNVVCLSYTTYQYCVTSGTQVVLINGIHTCANGTLCQENSTYICTNAADVVITTSTTTVAPVTPPAECNSVSVYPASNCSQFYECSSYLWLWYSLNLVSCPSGQGFNRASLTCTSDSSCNAATGEFVTTPMPTTTPPVTTTTAAPVTPPPACTSVSVYPAPNCSQYYECSSYLWVWYSLNLVSCPSGQAFNRTSLVCGSDSSCDRATGEFITTPVPTTTTPVPTTTTAAPTTTTAAPTTTTTPITITTTASVTPPTCNSVSVYPAANCSQYYECSSYLWLWYSLNLVSCPSGQAFNSTQLKCVVDSSCDRQTGIYTTLAMTTASTTVTTTKSTSPTTVSTAVPTTASTTVTTTKSTTAPTTAASTTVPTTAASTTVPTTAASTTVPTTAASTTVPTTAASTTVPTTASTAVPTTAPTAVPTTASTAVPTTASTAVPTTASTIVPTTASTVNTTVAITTTTAPVTPPAECTSVSVYPAPNCSQYYECSSYLWIWYSLNLLSCPSGQAFNSTQLKCVADSSCDPVTGKFTTTAITTATTPSLPL